MDTKERYWRRAVVVADVSAMSERCKERQRATVAERGRGICWWHPSSSASSDALQTSPLTPFKHSPPTPFKVAVRGRQRRSRHAAAAFGRLSILSQQVTGARKGGCRDRPADILLRRPSTILLRRPSHTHPTQREREQTAAPPHSPPTPQPPPHLCHSGCSLCTCASPADRAARQALQCEAM